jgi:hypothetical protein
VRAFTTAAFTILALALPIRAGLYSTEEPFSFEIGADGLAKPIQFAGGFDTMVAGFREISVQPRNPGDPLTFSRKTYLDRVEQTRKKGSAALSTEAIATYTADLIRLNRADEVLNLLHPIARDPRRGGFIVYAHLARAHAARGEWSEAKEQQQMAVRYTEFPTSFGRLTKAQLAWLKRVERDYYLPLLARRAEEPRRPGRDLREEVDAIFPSVAPPKRNESPVRFVGPSGEYIAGSIADEERKKLPSDAIAIVQQLVLWHPHDARLYWLLGELYNADGDVETAAKILDHCSFNMGYSNPTLLRHRQILQQASNELALRRAGEIEKAREAEMAEQRQIIEEQQRRIDAERAYQRRFWWILSIAVAVGLLLVYFQFREVFRRFRRQGGVS